MANIIWSKTRSWEETRRAMEEDASYEVADSREAEEACGAPLSRVMPYLPQKGKVPKLFLSNDCRFNCAYCGCRCTNDEKTRYNIEPKELARITVEAARENRSGIFITSAINQNADYTQERILETLRLLRCSYGYTGYLHAKVMPGADPLLIEQTGFYADRLSVNIEVAKSEGYARIAKQKNRKNILTPMGQISKLIQRYKQERRPFATTQTTQLMAGSTGEDDRTILNLSKALYQKYNLKRVYYTAFQYQHPAQGYDFMYTSTPKWRVRRLYQADRLMELYGFQPDEITPEGNPDLLPELDPKMAWAFRRISQYPVEINTADYETLLRVPGIGIQAAQRIINIRREGSVSWDTLAKTGAVMSRCRYFVMCNGKSPWGQWLDHPDFLRRQFEEPPPQMML